MSVLHPHQLPTNSHSAALAFLAQEAGCIVTTLTGELPPLHTCENYRNTTHHGCNIKFSSNCCDLCLANL